MLFRLFGFFFFHNEHECAGLNNFKKRKTWCLKDLVIKKPFKFMIYIHKALGEQIFLSHGDFHIHYAMRQIEFA